MSTNFHITAKRDICVVNTGCIEVQEMNCNLVWQTPTEITYQIMQSSDKMQAYIDWVLSISKDVEEKVYAEDDIFGKRDPIATRIINHGEDHIERLFDWCNNVAYAGYELHFESW